MRSRRWSGWWSCQRRTIVSASMPGPARPRRMGRSAGSPMSTRTGPWRGASFGDKLRPNHPHDDARGPAALEHLAHLFANAPELLEPALLDLDRGSGVTRVRGRDI